MIRSFTTAALIELPVLGYGFRSNSQYWDFLPYISTPSQYQVI